MTDVVEYGIDPENSFDSKNDVEFRRSQKTLYDSDDEIRSKKKDESEEKTSEKRDEKMMKMKKTFYDAV